MKVKELKELCEKLIEDGYGEYSTFNDGYLNEIEEKNIVISNGEVIF